MIQFSIFLIVKNPCQHGSVFNTSARNRRINRIIHKTFRITHGLKSAKSKIIIPWYHLHLTVFFIKIIVVNHRTGVTVKIQYEVMHYEITYHAVNIHSFRNIFFAVQFFQCIYQALFITVRNIRFCIVKNIFIAVNFIIRIL